MSNQGPEEHSNEEKQSPSAPTEAISSDGSVSDDDILSQLEDIDFDLDDVEDKIAPLAL